MSWLQIVIYLIIALSFLYPLLRKGHFASSLVLGNLVIFLLMFVLLLIQPVLVVEVFLEMAFRPVDLQTLRLQTIISSMFLHANPAHIIGNVLSLYLLGLPLEQRIGGPAFGATYLATGIIATVGFGLVHWGSIGSAVGASGAIMGIAGAFLILYPRDRIFMILGFIAMPNVPVYLAVGVIIAGQFILLAFSVPGIAVEAHLAGVGAGILLAPLIVRPKREARGMEALELDDLATTEELKDILQDIKAENVPEVRDAWIDHFLQKASCPRCRGPLQRRGRVVESDCGWQRRL